MSMPWHAIGKRPTAVNTEKRPPTLSGTTNVSYPSASAKVFNAPRALSVVAKILLRASSLPYLAIKACCNTLNAIAGSVVVPDLEITLIE